MSGIMKIFWQAVIKLNNEGGLAIASNIALSLLLSLFPFLMLIASLLRVYGDPALADDVIQLVLGHWPADAAAPIAKQVKVIISQSPGEFFSISTFVALLLATNGVESARDGLNRAYKVRESRSFFWRRIQGVLFVLTGALGLIVAAFILVGTPLVWLFLIDRVPWLNQFAFTITLVQYGLAVLILWVVLFCFHRFLPQGERRFQDMIWGVLITIAGIIAGSKLFALYLLTIANYTALYAGLAGTMIAIVYLYCISVLILFGAEFNSALLENRQTNAVS